MTPTEAAPVELLKELTDIGIALSAEKDHVRLLEIILMKAKELTNADGATIYECIDDNQLKFGIMFTESLGIHLGGTSGKEITFNPLPMYDKEGKKNTKMVATCVATSGQTVNIKDVYQEEKYDFTGTFEWDKKIGYHSKSFLTVPMTNHLNELIGVLQLINAQDKTTKSVIAFSDADQQIVESLASQAAVSITNSILIDSQKKLFDALIQLIATAIDEKSPYTAGHCRRVPVITRMLVDAACRIDKGPLKDFTMTEDEIYEIEVAAWLHDCGKLTTPEYVVDKATKLEAIFDRIHLIDTRFEVLKRDAVISSLSRQITEISGKDSDLSGDAILQKQLDAINEDRDFLRECNIGKESINKEDTSKILRIGAKTWVAPSGEMEPFLSDSELDNLQIFRGTLSIREREIINNHVVVTAQMLESLPYPKKMQRIPEFARCHHEKMDGTGYPKGLKGEQMSIQARILAIADVFEALSASDRPYKKGMPLSQCLAILGEMKLSGHIDPDLFDVFLSEKVYLEYATLYLDKNFIDEIDINSIPGYVPL